MGTIGLDIKKGLYLGIDFGTTNSVVSVYMFEKGEILTIPIDGSNISPSVIQFEKDDQNPTKLNKIFGFQARESALIYPESTVISIKRLLGSDEKVIIKFDEESYVFSPEEVAGQILANLKQKADEYIQQELKIDGEFSGCVITVPANSTDKQKRKTKEAAIMAGFDENSIFLRLEPTAAAIYYASNQITDKKVLIYDFGGGTFDACIVDIKIDENKDAQVSMLSSYGDNNLGGNDVDKIIMDIIYEEFKKITENKIDLFDFDVDDGISKRHKKMALLRLLQISTQTKERLSNLNSTKVVLAPFLQEPNIINLNMEITLDTFLNHKRINKLGDNDIIFEKFKDKNIIDLIDLTVKCIDKCLSAASLSENQIDEIFLVGGSSSIGIIGNIINKKFGKEPYKSKISPALSISQGAAFYCNFIMMPTLKGTIIHEKTVHPLGLEITGRKFLEIVKPGMNIPKEGLVVESSEILTTAYDNLSSMAIVVYENTNHISSDKVIYVYEDGMKRLAGTSLRDIPQKPKGVEKVKVIFNVGQDNILTVTAKSMSDDGVVTELKVDELYNT